MNGDRWRQTQTRSRILCVYSINRGYSESLVWINLPARNSFYQDFPFFLHTGYGIFAFLSPSLYFQYRIHIRFRIIISWYIHAASTVHTLHESTDHVHHYVLHELIASSFLLPRHLPCWTGPQTKIWLRNVCATVPLGELSLHPRLCTCTDWLLFLKSPIFPYKGRSITSHVCVWI